MKKLKLIQVFIATDADEEGKYIISGRYSTLYHKMIDV